MLDTVLNAARAITSPVALSPLHPLRTASKFVKWIRTGWKVHRQAALITESSHPVAGVVAGQGLQLVAGDSSIVRALSYSIQMGRAIGLCAQAWIRVQNNWNSLKMNIQGRERPLVLCDLKSKISPILSPATHRSLALKRSRLVQRITRVSHDAWKTVRDTFVFTMRALDAAEFSIPTEQTMRQAVENLPFHLERLQQDIEYLPHLLAARKGVAQRILTRLGYADSVESLQARMVEAQNVLARLGSSARAISNGFGRGVEATTLMLGGQPGHHHDVNMEGIV